MIGTRWSDGASLGVLALVLMLETSGHAADAWLYKMTKGIHYQQLPGGSPTVLPENGYVFQANVFMTAPGRVSGATVVSREGTVRTLAPNGNDELEFRNRVNSKATLETRYPDGNFTYTIHAVNDGQRVIRLPMLGNVYPPGPLVHNLVALQAVNANGHLVVSWDPFPGGRAWDHIQLRIEDSTGNLAWESRDYGEPGALDGTATHTIIKPAMLKPSTAYQATLLFEKSCSRDNASYPGAFGWSTYHARTEFPIRTSSAAAANVASYELAKGRSFEQTNAAPPTPEPGDEFIFSAEVRASAAGLVSSAGVTSPAGTAVVLVPDSDGEQFEFSESSADQSAIETRFPPGNYIVQMQTASEGTRSVALPFNAGQHPPAPRLHFDPTQTIVAEAELRLAWDAWSGGTGDDFIQLRIEDEDGGAVFETPDFDDKDALDGRATSAQVPAGTFVRGKDYEARLTFRRFARLDTSSYPGALGIASYFTRTKFEIRTVRPDLQEFSIEKGRAFEQTSVTGPLTPDAGDEFTFSAQVEASTAGSIQSASLTTPPGATVPLEPDTAREDFDFEDVAATEASFDAEYPAGAYRFNIQGTQGSASVVLNVPAGGFPPVPRAQFDSGQKVRPGQALIISWQAWPDGTASDFVQFRIDDKSNDETVFETPDEGDAGALDGRAASVTVPAGTFEIGKEYEARLVFRRVAVRDEDTVPGADGIVRFFSRTKFDIEALPPDAQEYSIEKGRAFEQTSATGPLTPDAGDEFTFSAQVEASTAGSIQSASLTTPPGATVPLEPDTAREDFDFEDVAATEASFDAEYPAGAYRFNVQGAQGSASVVLNVPAGGFPPVPRAQFDSSQKVRPDQALTISWEAWPDGTANDFVQFRIDDKSNDETVFETPDEGDAGALDGRAASVTVPAGTFEIGKEYEARLVFRRVAVRDEDTLPGADKIVRFFSRTKFDIEALPPDAQEYSIEKGRAFEQTSYTVPPTPDPGSEFIFNAQAEASAAGNIQSATLTTPAGATVPLTADTAREDYDFEDATGTITNFAAMYPVGAYRFNVQGTQGSTSVALTVPEAAFPPFPRARFDSNQRVRPDQVLTLSWDGWAGGTTNDLIRLRIEEEESGETVFETANHGDAGALNGAATSVVLPAGLFEAGKEYEARLTFRRFLVRDENLVPGAEGTVSIFSRTQFDLETAPPDVKSYEVRKERLFVQTNASGLLATGFVFRAEIETETAESVATAAILTPTGRTLTLVQQRSGDEFRFVDARTSQAALDADYPEGNYILAINTVNDGGKNIPIALTNAAYSNAPRLGNYDAAGRINASAEFILTWDAFAGGTAKDFIEVKIEEMDGDEILDTENYGKTEALNGQDSGVTLPPFLLQAGRCYVAEIYFEKVIRANDTGYPGADGRVGYASTTFVPIASTGPGNPPLLQSYRVLTDRRIQFYLTTLDGGTYQIQGSPDMLNWTTLGTVSASANLSAFTAPPPAGPTYFYRAILVR